jgi:hypothetical protein
LQEHPPPGLFSVISPQGVAGSRQQNSESIMAVTTKIPVFISFDYDHDSTLKELLIGQAKNKDSPFFIEDWSIKIESDDWKDKARTRIRRADQVIVLCGKNTDTATGVNAEIKIAREELTPYFLLAGYSNGGNKKPTAALDSDKMYKWTWDGLKTLIGGGR